jgi:hypothetical protein
MDSGLGFVQPMFFVGVVEDRNDPRVEGRVRVRAFGVHGSNKDIATEDLPWATLIIGNHDVNFTPPPLNAWVFGFFIDGRDAQQPMILGLIPSQASELVDPNTRGWGAVPAENYDRESQGARPRDLGLSPMSRLATGEFLNETYNEALETNRVRNIPVAGGCARGHNAVGNGNIWSNDLGETADVSTRSAPVFITADDREGIDNLDNDPAFQAELRRLTQKYGISREQVYGIILGEGAIRNPSKINDFGYAGLFQFGQKALTDINRRQGTNYTPQSIARLSPAEQLRVYDNYLDRWNFRNSSGLGVLQAAPGFASRPGSTEVYAVGTRAWQRNPGWRGPDGRITVDSINAYYNIRNPPPLEQQGPQLLDPSQPDRVQQAQLDEQRFGRANELTTEINRLEQERDKLGTTGVDATARDQLNEQIRQKEAELAALDTSNPTQGTAGEPYSGYANPSNAPGCVSSWEEPPSGYSARYPYNRVIETASGHSIELDDTPGGERIMIWHRDGSYVQITGTSTTHKNMSDAYHINERNNHVYIGGNNIVTIEGDSYVLIKGDKVEEIEGNYKQIVHGNVQIGGGGRVEINGADRTDIRSASLSLDSNVENLNIRTGKNIVFESGESFNVKSKNVRLGASENMSVTGKKGLFLQSQGGDIHVKSDGNVYLNPDQNLFLRTEGGTISAEAKGSIRFNSSGSFISINSSSYMSLGSKGEMLIGAEGGSLNLNSSENLGISGKNTFIKGAENINIKAEGGMTNIGADGDITLDTNGDFFVGASGDVNMKSVDIKLEGSGAVDIKAGGGPVSIDASGAVNLLAGQLARLTGSNVHISGQVVAIDDIVQLANGIATSASPADGAADGNDVEVKEPIDPSRFGDGTGEMGGDIAAQAQSAEVPASVKSATDGPATPPDRTIKSHISIPPTNQSSGSPIVNREATIIGALPLSETTVLGTFGTPQSARTLIRTPEGRVATFRVGDIIQGRSIISINPLSGEVTFQGENAFSTRTLRVPQ